MKDLDKTQVYDLRGITEEQARELYELLIVHDEGWSDENYKWIRESFSLEYIHPFWALSDRKPTTHISILFEQSYEQQLQEAKKQLEHYKREIERLENERRPTVNSICKLWNDDESDFIIGTVVKIRNLLLDGTRLIFLSSSGYGFKHAKKLTEQEVIDLLFKKS